MAAEEQAAASGEHGTTWGANRVAVTQCVVLIVLAVWALWPELEAIAKTAIHNSDWAHVLVVPLAVVILLYRRRSLLADSLTGGSVWGLMLLLGGFALLGASTWPFDYGYFRVVAVVPVLAGIVLAVGGWGVFKRCLPMLLLVFLSIPIGQRKYADLIIIPETYTLAATHRALNALPGVVVDQDGVDLTFHRASGSGTIALGESRRGASLFLAYTLIGVFVAFVRLRPAWQVVVMALAAVPIVLFCNLLRILTWGLMAIYAGSSATSAAPRGVAAVVSLLAAYGLFAALGLVLTKLVTEQAAYADDDEDQEGPDD